MSDGVKGPWTQQEIYFRDQLTAMAKLPENSECADCSSKAPRWAVFNHGIFVCIKCSGQHRNLGAGISKVRSINLDRWKPEQFAMMCGNSLANAELLYNLPANLQKPLEEEDYQRQKWIHSKYVQRKWARRPDQPPVPGHPSSEQQVPVEQAPTPTSRASSSSVQQSTTPHVISQPQFTKPTTFAVPAKFDMPQPAPPPRMAAPAPKAEPAVVQQQPVPQSQNNIEDLLDLFGTGPSAPPAQQQKQPVYAQQPAQQPANPQPAPKTNDVFDDLMSMYDQPTLVTPQIQQPQTQNPQVAQKKGGFDFSAFINTDQQQQSAANSYKPAGFDW